MKTSECLTTDSAPVMLTMAALSQEYGAKKIGIPEFKSQVSRSRTLWVEFIDIYRGFWPDQEVKNLHGNETAQLNLKVLKSLALNA